MRRMAPRSLPKVICAFLGLVLLAGCTGPTGSPGVSPSPSGSPGPTIQPTPTPADALSPAELRYLLLDAFSPLSWCDPDFYPIAHADEQNLAEQRLPEIRADDPTFAAITTRLGIGPSADLSPAEVLAIYRDWKLLNAVALQPGDGGLFGFELITETNPGLGQGVRSAGTIDTSGAIVVQVQEQAMLVGCPICLARGTLIDTPDGPVAVEQLAVGDIVWTVDADGQRVARALLAVGSTPVPASHQVVHVVLDDGREVWVSAGHPLADGRLVGELRATDTLDGARVVSALLTAYSGGSTFDILPAGSSGLYWANGILLASTLR